MNQPVQCACPTCNCVVDREKGVLRDGKLYCSNVCAYECTEKTCVCVHESCEHDEKHTH